MPPPPPLVDDVVEDVLIRFPPTDPAALVRAGLVCKSWLRLVSSPSFRRRFSEFHRKPPMLGMLANEILMCMSHFVPTTAFRPHDAVPGRIAVDARHGRVLLQDRGTFNVWDPITDKKWKVPFPPISQRTGLEKFTAAVLCSAPAGAGGCDHLDCHHGPFIVVFVADVRTGPAAVETFIYTYSSKDAAWSEPTCGHRPGYFVNPWIRSALVGNTLYFADKFGSGAALKYNVQLRQMSWIQLPPSLPLYHCLSALTTTEGGGLRCAIRHEEKLYIWSTKDADDEVDARWEQNRVIEVNKLLPVDADLTLPKVVGFMDGLGTIFVSAADAAYAIDLMTCKVKKVYEGTINTTIIPYMSFYTPALQADDTGDGGSSA